MLSLSIRLLILSFLSLPLFGEDPLTLDAAAPGMEEMQFGFKFMQMVFSLGFILLILVTGAWITKRFFKQRLLQMNTVSYIKIREQRSLSPRSSLYLLEINGQGLLIGESQTTLELLGKVDLKEDQNNGNHEK